MKIEFGQIYPEVNISFNLSSDFLRLLMNSLDKLDLKLPYYERKYNGSEYKLVIIISASRKISEIQVKGPITLRKRPEIEFAFHIPYVETESFEQKIEYISNQICLGMINILEKYKAPCLELEKAIYEVVEIVSTSSEKYKSKRDN